MVILPNVVPYSFAMARAKAGLLLPENLARGLSKVILFC